jgi:protoheme IX farnesyltransferase
MIKDYYELTKPGIIYGNAITAIAGFLLAWSKLLAKSTFDIKLFVAMLIGLSLVIAAGCVFNNIYDSKIDAVMERTKNRAIASGKISKRSAFIFGVILIFLGLFILHFHTNRSALLAALLGFVVYVFIYTPLKHKTVYATLIGAIAGATPPVVGYTAVTNNFDITAIILFIILVLWQMPHFYSIAIYRMKDYAAASIPVLPIKSGIKTTKIHILIYIIAFIVAAFSLRYYNITGDFYAGFTTVLGLTWLYYAIKGFKTPDDVLWAKKMFKFSLIVLTSLSVLLALNNFLP